MNYPICLWCRTTVFFRECLVGAAAHSCVLSAQCSQSEKGKKVEIGSSQGRTPPITTQQQHCYRRPTSLTPPLPPTALPSLSPSLCHVSHPQRAAGQSFTTCWFLWAAKASCRRSIVASQKTAFRFALVVREYNCQIISIDSLNFYLNYIETSWSIIAFPHLSILNFMPQRLLL